jgi:hypothetical protein
MSLQILPLAITMMAGPQIMSAIVFVTSPKAVKLSLAFLAGVAISATVGVAVFRGLAGVLGDKASLGNSSDNSSLGHVIQYALVGLLVLMALKNYRDRATIRPPKWMGTLMTADPRRALKMGLLLIALMPSDLVVMLTVGVNLEQNDASLASALPFIGLTVLVAALPLLAYLLFRTRAQRAMPKVRDWMNDTSWLVNVIVCAIFILLILA